MAKIFFLKKGGDYQCKKGAYGIDKLGKHTIKPIQARPYPEIRGTRSCIRLHGMGVLD